MKRIIIVLGAILVFETLLAGILLTSFKPLKNNVLHFGQTSPMKKNTPLSTNVLPNELILKTLDNQIVLKKEILSTIIKQTEQSDSTIEKKLSPQEYIILNIGIPLHNTNDQIHYAFNKKILGSTLLNFSRQENRDPQDAILQINKDGKVEKFKAHRSGQLLDLKNTSDLIFTSLESNQESKLSINVLLIESTPNTVLGDLNDFGIKELIARGISDFSGSSKSRINNITVGASRYDGLIINKGDEFSFNKHLGPVTASAGFLPELVIKPEGTIPEYGGGLCQVSTTAFRAAFFGGLDITQRKNHSYAVKYYKWISEDIPSAEGMDATIYPGAVDMKFINDTNGSILIDTYINGNRLYFDFYGTPDNRKITVDGPHTYDRRSSGAVKADVKRTVVKNGQKSEKNFHSDYRSPNLFPRTYELQKESPEKAPEPQTPEEQKPAVEEQIEQ